MVKVTFDADRVIIQGQKLRLAFRPVVSRDDYLRGAIQLVAWWRPDNGAKWVKMNSQARSIVPVAALLIQPDFFIVQQRTNSSHREAQQSFTIRFEPAMKDAIGRVADPISMASFTIHAAIEEFEGLVERKATEWEIEGLRLLAVNLLLEQIKTNEGGLRLADTSGKRYFPDGSELYLALGQKLMVHAYNAAVKECPKVVEKFYALFKEDNFPQVDRHGAQLEVPDVTRIGDGIRVESGMLRIELGQAATEEKASAGAIQVAVWKKIKSGANAGSALWEPLNNCADTIAPLGSFMCTDENLIVHDRWGLGRPEYDELFSVWLAPGMAQPLAAAALQLQLASAASRETLRIFAEAVKRPPTPREVEAVRVLISKYLVDQADADQDMTFLADVEGKPYFPQEEPLIQVLVTGKVLPHVFRFATELSKTLLPKLEVYLPQGHKAQTLGKPLQ